MDRSTPLMVHWLADDPSTMQRSFQYMGRGSCESLNTNISCRAMREKQYE